MEIVQLNNNVKRAADRKESLRCRMAALRRPPQRPLGSARLGQESA